MPWIISFHAKGEFFRPSNVDFPFTESFDYGDVVDRGRHRNEPKPHGYAVIEVPTSIPNEKRLTYIATLVLSLLPRLKQAGMETGYVNIGRYYSTQCNEEYTAEEIALLAQLNCPLIYSAYAVSEDDEEKLRQELETSSRSDDVGEL